MLPNDHAKPCFARQLTLIGGARPPQDRPQLRQAVLLLAKDEAGIIGQNLLHHYKLGFSRFSILDSESRDEAALRIAEFEQTMPGANVFMLRFVAGYYQAAKMKALDAFIQIYLRYDDKPPTRLFIGDANEFICCGVADIEDRGRLSSSIPKYIHKKLLIFHWAWCASPTIIQDLPCSPKRSVDQLRRRLTNGQIALSGTEARDGLQETASHWRIYSGWYGKHGDDALRSILAKHTRVCLQS